MLRLSTVVRRSASSDSLGTKFPRAGHSAERERRLGESGRPFAIIEGSRRRADCHASTGWRDGMRAYGVR